MDKETRNAIERATQRARKLLEEDFAAQLEGEFDVQRAGFVAAKPGSHLDPRRAAQRERIVASIEHKRAAGMSAVEAVADYLRDAAFTTLNRFAALKMLEARELVQECISKGEDSSGYREFCGLAPGLPLLLDSAGYRLYIESLFDELSTEIKVLFDRRDPASVLWPKRATFEALLALLNGAELAGVWSEDETIGWVYQYFNGADERRKMREESQAPRNSRELAVRNQFFTPRYVVQFLTDNTLGRIWYEMRGGNTVLAERCEYMVRKPGEEYLPRQKRDPRDLRVLDPACGSGHFLLYAFDLLLVIYEEAYSDPDGPESEVTGKRLAEDYSSLDALRRAAPGLVLAHNLHGVDIDPRSAQIAQLALWLRAQKAFRDFGVGRAKRAQIRRSNTIVAEPIIVDDQMAQEFVEKLGEAELGRVFLSLVASLRLAGDLGLLLRLEQLVKTPTAIQGELFTPPVERIRAALHRFLREEASATSTRRRLFADDAAHGAALFGVAQIAFDVVVMNPPMSEASTDSKLWLKSEYPTAAGQLAPAFVLRAAELLNDSGVLGAICNRPPMFIQGFEAFRRAAFLGDHRLQTLADVGDGDFEDVIVEVVAFVMQRGDADNLIVAIDLKASTDKAAQLLVALRDREEPKRFEHTASSLFRIPGVPVAYWLPESLLQLFDLPNNCSSLGVTASVGLSTKNDRRFVRAYWEVPGSGVSFSGTWSPYDKGGEYSPFFYPVDLVVRSAERFQEIDAEVCHKFPYLKGNSSWIVHPEASYGSPGASFQMLTTRDLAPRVMPKGCVFYIAMTIQAGARGDAPMIATAVFNSSLARVLVDALVGGGGGTLKNYEKGTVNRVPVPLLSSAQSDRLALAAERAVLARCNGLFQYREPSNAFRGLPLAPSLRSAHSLIRNSASECMRVQQESLREIDEVVAQALLLEEKDLQRIAELARTDLEVPLWELEDLALAYLSIGVGMAFGRYCGSEVLHCGEAPEAWASEWRLPEVVRPPRRHVLVDDMGHADDICVEVEAEFSQALGQASHELSREICEAIGSPAVVDDLRLALRGKFWSDHIRRFTLGRVKAPIYWQLATPSASYSVWLYIHAFSKDTLFRVQNDYVTPKLTHEGRRLELLASELRGGGTAAQRKALAAQEAFVEELRAFLAEVKRVAPLWNPDLDDGVIINFALLWRLVPQHKAWQKELKATWDGLCEGKYDWSHLAMHLWPERVLPKCATDRSFAITHGLQEVFWVGGGDGKWAARKTPTRPIEELVRERTSATVKAALKGLLEAPPLTGSNGARTGGRRRRATVGLGEET